MMRSDPLHACPALLASLVVAVFCVIAAAMHLGCGSTGNDERSTAEVYCSMGTQCFDVTEEEKTSMASKISDCVARAEAAWIDYSNCIDEFDALVRCLDKNVTCEEWISPEYEDYDSEDEGQATYVDKYCAEEDTASDECEKAYGAEATN